MHLREQIRKLWIQTQVLAQLIVFWVVYWQCWCLYSLTWLWIMLVLAYVNFLFRIASRCVRPVILYHRLKDLISGMASRFSSDVK